jgi:hypothetical protein
VALATNAKLEQVPEDVAEFLRHIHDRNVERNTRLKEQLHEVLIAFNRSGIEPLLMKGAAHLFTSAPETLGVRMMCDLDILVERPEIAAAEKCFVDLGCQPMSALGWGRPKDVGLIDLHYPPGSLAIYYSIATTLGAQSKRASVDGAWAIVPSPTCRAAHLVVHDQIKDGDWWLGRLDLRHLYELAELARSQDGIDWHALVSAMPNQLSRNVLESQLIAVREMFGTRIPDEVIAGRRLPRWQHARRRFQAYHPVAGAPLHAAGYVPWAIRCIKVEWGNRESLAALATRLARKLRRAPAQTLPAMFRPGTGPKA